MWSVKKEQSLNSIMACISTTLVIVAGVGACLLRGLFFTEELYFFLTLWFMLCCLVLIDLLIGAMGWRSREGSFSGGNRVVKIFVCVPVVVLLLYVIHWLRGPLSAQGTINEILRWGMYSTFAFIICSCAVNRVGRQILNVAWSLLGMFLSISALLAVYRVLELPFAIAYSDSSEVSATGARLAGVLEYPNAFGAVMAIFLMERLFAVATYEAREREKVGGTRAVLLRSLPLFPYAAALLLSESRGAWLTAACASAAVLLWKRQLIAPLLAAGAAPVAAAALLYRQLARAGLAVEPGPGLLVLAGLWAGALLAGLWLCRRERSAAGSARAAMLALAAAGWTAAGTAVLLHVRERITGPSSTVSARELFYRDAWRLAVEAPWLGRGGETWRSSYLAAQSRPYVGSQVHSGYLDILLNLGFVGLAAILLLLLAAGWLLATRSPRLLPPFLVIVLHSAVDFDWSYGLFWMMLFWLPALALAESEQEHQSSSPHLMSTALLTNHSMFMNLLATGLTSATPLTSRPASAKLSALRPLRTHLILRRLFIALVCGLFLMLPILSYQAMQGERYYRQALQTTDPLVKESLLQRSLAWNPRSPRTAVVLSKLLPGEQSISILQQSLLYSPENAGLSWEMAKRWMSSDDSGTALYWIHRSIRLDVYNNAKWVKAIEGMLVMGHTKLVEGNTSEALTCIASGQVLLRQYRMLAEYEATQGEQHNDRKFRITEQADDLGRRLNVLASRF